MALINLDPSGIVNTINPFHWLEKAYDKQTSLDTLHEQAQLQYQLQKDAQEATWNLQEDQQAFAMNQQIQAQEYDTQMWYAQNEYDSPVNQIERMKAAGINPNDAAAAIAGGSSSGASAPSSPAVGAPAVGSPVGGVAGASVPASTGDFLVPAQIEQLRSETKLNDENSRYVEAQTKGQILDNEWKPMLNQSELDTASAKIDLMVKEGQLASEQATQIKEMLPLTKDLTVKQTLKFEAEIDQVKVKMDEIRQNISLLREKIKTEKSYRNSLDAAAKASYEQVNVNKSIVKLNGKELSLKNAELVLKQLEGGEKALKFNYRKFMMDKYNIDIDDNHVDRFIDVIGGVIHKFSFENKASFFRSLWSETQTKLHMLGGSDFNILDMLQDGEPTSPPSIPPLDPLSD